MNFHHIFWNVTDFGYKEKIFHQGGNKVQDRYFAFVFVFVCFVTICAFVFVFADTSEYLSACIFVYPWTKCWTVQAVTKRHLLD